MQRVSECESVVFCGAAARLRRAAAPCFGGGQPEGLAAAKTSLSIQKVFDCKWYKCVCRALLAVYNRCHFPSIYSLRVVGVMSRGAGIGACE
jgi:hypothetical protein